MANHDMFVAVLKSFDERWERHGVLHLTQHVGDFVTKESTFAAEALAQRKASSIGS